MTSLFFRKINTAYYEDLKQILGDDSNGREIRINGSICK